MRKRPESGRRGFFVLLAVGFLLGGPAWAETIELVTYYPTSSNTGNQHVNALTVGTAYQATTPADGGAFIVGPVGIGTTNPRGPLHVVGANDVVSNVNFSRGADTVANPGTPQIRVGIGHETGTSVPLYALDVVGFRGANQSIYSRALDGSLARLGLENTRRHWSISNYGTQFAPNGAFVIADEAPGAGPRLMITDRGNVGIGTTDPQGLLHVAGAQDTLNQVLFMPGQDTVAPGTPDMRVGIGTETPQFRLHVDQYLNGLTGAAVTNRNGAGAAIAELRVGEDVRGPVSGSLSRFGSLRYWGSGFAPLGYQNPNQVGLLAGLDAVNGLAIATYANAPIKFLTNMGGGAGNERMRILGNGQVGIGTNAPGYPLEVINTIHVRSQAGGMTRLGLENARRHWSISNYGTQPGLIPGLFVIADETGGITRFTIAENGNVGIGTNTPAFKLDVQGTAHKLNNATTWDQISDIRLKKDIHPIEGALGKMLQLHGVWFKWKEPERQGNFTDPQMGLIGQEVEKVFPDWVSKEGPDGMRTLAFRGFEAVAIEAMRELNQRIDELKMENDALKQRVETLEKSKKQ